MSANHAAFNLIFRFVELYNDPVAGRISSQRHVMAIRGSFHLGNAAVYDCQVVPAGLCFTRRFRQIPRGLHAPGWIWRKSLKGGF